METKQTAVEFLIEHIKLDAMHKAKSIDEWVNVFQQAKSMEKKQIKNSFNEGQNNSLDYFIPYNKLTEAEQYYEETYGSNN